jgi:hypothetical protein
MLKKGDSRQQKGNETYQTRLGLLRTQGLNKTPEGDVKNKGAG